MLGKITTFISALVALTLSLGSGVSARARWELIPLTEGADPTTFNSTSYDPAVWNVTKIMDLPDENEGTVSPAASTATPFPTPEYGNSPGFCVGSQTEGDCCIGVRVPQAPTAGYALMDSWIYTQKCERIRGYYLHQLRQEWKSIFSDLPYTTDVRGNYNGYPFFKYSGYHCSGRLCLGWTFVYDDPSKYGTGVVVYRHIYPCNGGS